MTPTNLPPDPSKEIPDEEMKRIIAAAYAHSRTQTYDLGQTDGYIQGARAEYLRNRKLSEERQPGFGWISVEDRTPAPIKGKDWSENVLAFCEGRLMVMAYCWLTDGENSGWTWCNCYGDINGDPEFDDEYSPTYWMPLPTPPSKH